MKDTGALISRATMPDLAPVDDSLVEWWFLQGWVEGPQVPRSHVMLCLFRMRAAPGDTRPGAMLIQHLLTPATGQSWVDSRVTRETEDIFRRISARGAERLPRPLRAMLLRRHHADTDAWVRRSGITVDPCGPTLQAEPLALSWGDFGLSRHDETLAVSTQLGDRGALALELTPTGPWLDESSAQLHGDLGDIFYYRSCPRMAAQGSLGGLPVTGQFWFDRQWGGYDGWLLDERDGGPAVLGWDWFGINLDDGRDLLLFHHHDPVSRESRQNWGIVFENGEARPAGPVHRTPCGHWTSPRSGARYPVEWEIGLPEFGLELRTRPLARDQEIPIYGITSIWEGAVEVQGRAEGRPVGGTGRLELVGYGMPLTLSDRFRRDFTRFAMGVSGAFERRR